MRGETLIQLFDSKTGEKVFESKDSNLVTNAISKMLSPPNEWLYGNTGTNMLGHMFNAIPFAERAFGGVLLFDDNLPEDANTLLPPAGINNVGYAGGEYAGSNELRGSYNTNESGPVVGGYRHVWDFATDKANGTIKSVCLTSLLGGNAGWKQPPQGDTSVAALSSLSSFVSPTQMQRIKNYLGRPIFVKATPEIGDVEAITYYNGNFYKVKEPSISDLKLSSKFNTTAGTGRNYTSEILRAIKTPTHSYTYPERRLYYMNGKIHHVYSTDGAAASMGLIHDIYDLDGVLEETKTLSTAAAFYGRAGSIFFFKGRYYAPTTSQGTSLSVFTEDGTLVNALEIGSNPVVPFTALMPSYIPQLDSIMLTVGWASSTSSSFFYRLEEGLKLTAFSYTRTGLDSFMFVPTADNILPYALLSHPTDEYEGGGVIRSFYALWTNYLGTINNLATSVTKTASQTMKLVYTIYDN